MDEIYKIIRKHCFNIDNFGSEELKKALIEAYNLGVENSARSVKTYWIDLEQTEKDVDIDSILKLKL